MVGVAPSRAQPQATAAVESGPRYTKGSEGIVRTIARVVRASASGTEVLDMDSSAADDVDPAELVAVISVDVGQ